MAKRDSNLAILDENGRLFIDHSNAKKYRDLIESVRSHHYQVENQGCIESEGFYAVFQAIRNGKRFPSEAIATYELRLIIKRRIIDYLRSPIAGREWLIASSDFTEDENLEDRSEEDKVAEDFEEEMEMQLILKFFTPIEQKFLSLKIEGMTDDEIADEIKCTRYQVAQLKAHTRQELEKIVRERGINTHLLPETFLKAS